MDNNFLEIDLSQQIKNAGLSEDDLAIKFSSKLIFAFSEKRKAHNKNNSNKVSIKEIKEEYRIGAGDCLGKDPNSEGLARVNMFLRMKSESKSHFEKEVKEEKVMEGLIFEENPDESIIEYDISNDWRPNQDDFSVAKEDVEKFDLNFNLKNLDDLYIDEYKKLDIYY